MRKLKIAFSLVLVFLFVTTVFASSPRSSREIDMSEIVNTYEFEECEVWSAAYETREDGSVGFVQAKYEDGNYIYFEFFTDAQSAQDHCDKINHPFSTFFFSLLDGDPTWQTVLTYNNICITYFDRRHYEPFSKLIG